MANVRSILVTLEDGKPALLTEEQVAEMERKICPAGRGFGESSLWTCCPQCGGGCVRHGGPMRCRWCHYQWCLGCGDSQQEGGAD
jgi:hypothetical protein